MFIEFQKYAKEIERWESVPIVRVELSSRGRQRCVAIHTQGIEPAQKPGDGRIDRR